MISITWKLSSYIQEKDSSSKFFNQLLSIPYGFKKTTGGSIIYKTLQVYSLFVPLASTASLHLNPLSRRLSLTIPFSPSDLLPNNPEPFLAFTFMSSGYPIYGLCFVILVLWHTIVNGSFWLFILVFVIFVLFVRGYAFIITNFGIIFSQFFIILGGNYGLVLL